MNAIKLASLIVLFATAGCGSYAPSRFKEPRNVFVDLHSPVTGTMGNGQPCFVVPAGRLQQVGQTVSEGVYEHTVTNRNVCKQRGL